LTATLQIVDAHGGALVLDLNGNVAGAGGYAKRGMNLTEGQLADSTLATDWSPLAGPSGLGRRRITIPFLLRGTSAEDLGAKVTKLMLSTQGPWWLKVRRHGATADCWLQCFGTVPQVESQITTSSVAHIAQGVISCETAPYALGARIDGSAAVGQDPSSDAWGVPINSVPGDAATPLLIRMNDASVFGLGAFGAFISVRKRQDPSTMVATAITRQAEHGSNTRIGNTGLTLSTVSTSEFSGGSGVRADFSSAYPALAAGQINFVAPTIGGVNAPGVYRMFIRIRRNSTALTQQLVLKPFVNGAQITPEDITVPAGGPAIRVVDLGLIQWPAAAPASIAAPVPNASGGSATRVVLQFWRKSAGAALVDFDYMAWIPADDDAGYLAVEKELNVPATQFVVVDGYQQLGMVSQDDPIGPHTILGRSFGGTTPTVDWTGGVPRVRPGTNRVFVVAGTGGVSSHPVNLNVNFAWSYWPRYTWLR
jgi:hypothetical protein